jgi:hypothetical protein
MEKGRTTRESICGITSLCKGKTDANQLLHLLRRHWEIEKGYENITEGIEVLAENKRAALRLVRFGRTE